MELVGLPDSDAPGRGVLRINLLHRLHVVVGSLRRLGMWVDCVFDLLPAFLLIALMAAGGGRFVVTFH